LLVKPNCPQIAGAVEVVVFAQEKLILIIDRQFVNALRAGIELRCNQVLKNSILSLFRVPVNDLSLSIHLAPAVKF